MIDTPRGFESERDLRSAVREAVRTSASNAVEDRLRAGAPAVDPDLAAWYASLPADGRKCLREVLAIAAGESVDGLFEVLDDVTESLPEEDEEDLGLCFVIASDAEDFA